MFDVPDLHTVYWSSTACRELSCPIPSPYNRNLDNVRAGELIRTWLKLVLNFDGAKAESCAELF